MNKIPLRLLVPILISGLGFVFISAKTIDVSQLELIPRNLPKASDSFWGEVPISSFTQIEPQPGEPASENTRLLIAQDEKNILVYIYCYQNPETIAARNTSRDSRSKSDDSISLLFDTFSDDRSSFGFWVNPLGTMADFRVADDGRTVDLNWDTEWGAEARRTSDGWAAMVRIPFKSIKYNKTLTTWGFNASRTIPHRSETSWWSGPMVSDNRISQGGTLVNVTVPKEKGITASIYPFITIRSEIDHTLNETYSDTEFGADLRLQIGTTLQANITYNPDFSTIEADRERVNLTRYELSYPEKRLFFQEGNEMFNTRIRTFYSRRISEIDHGAKVTGKMDRHAFSLLSTSGPEFGKESDVQFHVLRTKTDVLEASTVGFTFTEKRWDDGYARTLSADYELSLAKTWKLTGQFVGGSPGKFGETRAGYVRFARDTNQYHYHIRYTDMGEGFRELANHSGFVGDDNRREVDADASYKFLYDPSSAFRYLSIGAKNNIFWGQNGTLRGWHQLDYARLYLRNRFSIDLENKFEFRRYEKDFDNRETSIKIGFNTDESANAFFQHDNGVNEDLNFQRFRAGFRTKLGDKFTIEYNLDHINFDPDPYDRSTFINILSSNYFFTKDVWIRLFAQSHSSIDRTYVSAQFGWRFKPPFGAVYLIYNGDQYESGPHLRFHKEIFLMKFTYPFGS
ncbi:MAG: carbohydrate binding family 9 domain-containing protein [Opitutales bacterium]|nr:carbohydrate binding family 9 domain-containing protein [Opitutales bacterium]